MQMEASEVDTQITISPCAWFTLEQSFVRLPRVGSVLAGAFLYRQQRRKNGNKGTK